MLAPRELELDLLYPPTPQKSVNTRKFFLQPNTDERYLSKNKSQKILKGRLCIFYGQIEFTWMKGSDIHTGIVNCRETE